MIGDTLSRLGFLGLAQRDEPDRKDIIHPLQHDRHGLANERGKCESDELALADE